LRFQAFEFQRPAKRRVRRGGKVFKIIVKSIGVAALLSTAVACFNPRASPTIMLEDVTDEAHGSALVLDF